MEDKSHTPTLKGHLWASVTKLMVARWGRSNLSRLAKEAGIGWGTTVRLQHDDGESTVGLDKVERLANVFGVDAWKLFDPAYDPDNEQPSLSMPAKELALTLDRITDPTEKATAYAMCMQMLSFVNRPQQQTPATGAAPKS